MKWVLFISLFIHACSSDTITKTPVDTDAQSSTLIDRTYNVISDSTNTLTGRVEELELDYITFGCACANWITPSDYNRYKKGSLAQHCIFIEPADSSLDIPLYFDPQRYSIKVKGEFYVRKDYPQGTIQTEEVLEKAAVFRYTKLKIVDHPERYYSARKKILILDYNAIECECAQWSESKFSKKMDKRELMYLERADENLIDADTLWKGSNLPLQIKVKGQFVSLVGFPKGYKNKKGEPEPAMVFRYTSIEILKR